MDRIRVLGAATTFAALVGYAVGVYAPYPGRGLTITGLMVGITLWAAGESS